MNQTETRVVYINSDNIEQVKKDAAMKTQNIISMLLDGIRPRDIAASMGIPIGFVTGLSNVVGLKVDKTKSWHSVHENTNGISINVRSLGFEGSFQWKVAECDIASGTIKIETRKLVE